MANIENGEVLKTIITNTEKIREFDRRILLLEESSRFWMRMIFGGIVAQLIAISIAAYLNWLLHEMHP